MEKPICSQIVKTNRAHFPFSSTAQLWTCYRRPLRKPASRTRWWWAWTWPPPSFTARGSMTWTSSLRPTQRDTSQPRSWLTSTRASLTTTQVDDYSSASRKITVYQPLTSAPPLPPSQWCPSKTHSTRTTGRPGPG